MSKNAHRMRPATRTNRTPRKAARRATLDRRAARAMKYATQGRAK